jgi:nicotinate phosphoribosyltransferase
MKAAQKASAEGILFTDQYQLTMAQLYFRHGLHEREALFEHFYRSNPNYGEHQAGYCINAGLEWLINWMQKVHFRDDDIAYLRSMQGRGGKPLFSADFLGWLRKHGHFDGLSLRAIPEGRVVHPNVPLNIVQGPLLQGQLLETRLLNELNYQTLIATKAARIKQVGRGGLMLEFGARRAQSTAALAGARAALIGGADFTSNVGISQALGFFPRGTHAHSMVQVFIALGGTELDAFRAYADIYPDDCLLLVDTIDSLHSGIPNAITVFEELRRKGHEPNGIRLDSGDLAHLSVQAAKMLNEAGFPKTSIVLSNNLDELVILQIITQIQEEAPAYGIDAEQIIKRLVYGVGTRLITSHGDSALDGVYKLVAVMNGDEWHPAMKISESPEKVLNPARKKAYRVYDARGRATADVITLAEELLQEGQKLILRHPSISSEMREIESLAAFEALHVEVMHEGKLVCELPTIQQMRELRQTDIERLDAGVRRMVNPHIYHVSLSQKLWELKQSVIKSLKR